MVSGIRGYYELMHLQGRSHEDHYAQHEIRRLIARDGITEEYARSRIAAQHSDAWFRERCSHTLANDGTAEEFRQKCLAFFRGLGIMVLEN